MRHCLGIVLAALALAGCGRQGAPVVPAAEAPGEAAAMPTAAVTAEPSRPAQGWFAAGVEAYESGECQQATRAFAQAVIEQPGNTEAHRMYGYCLMDGGRVAEAVAHLEVPANLDSQDPQVWARLAKLYRKQGKLDQALACALKAEQIAPGSVDLKRLLGGVLMDKGRYDQAIRAYMKALERGDKAWVRNNLGMAYLQNNQPEEGHRELLRAVYLDPKNATFHNNLGVAYQRLGRYSEARREFAEAVRLNPSYTRAIFNLKKADLRIEAMQATSQGE